MKVNIFFDDKMTDGSFPYPMEMTSDGEYLRIDAGSFGLIIPERYIKAVMEEGKDDKSREH